MAVMLNEDSKPYPSADDEEDALLNEAICCSRNLEIKTDDDTENDEDEEAELKKIANNEKMDKEVEKLKPSPILWCDMESDTNLSELSTSNGKINSSSDTSLSEVKVNTENNVQNEKTDKSHQNEDKDSLKTNVEVENTTETRKATSKTMDTSDDSENATPCKRIKQEDPEEEPKMRSRRNSDTSCSTLSNASNKKVVEYETDPAILARRRKDIDYGKNTIGYDVYTQKVAKDRRTKDHPRTPPMHLKYSRRGWDGMVKLWRKKLHMWDPEKEDDNES